MFLLTAKTWSETIQYNYPLQNAIAAVVFLVITYFVYNSVKDERGREIWRYIFRRKLSGISFLSSAFSYWLVLQTALSGVIRFLTIQERSLWI